MNTRTTVGALAGIAMFAASDASATTEFAVDERSQSIVLGMGEFLSGLRQLSFTATVWYDRVLDSGKIVEVHEVHEIAVKRPGKLRATVLGENGLRAAIVGDGVATIVDPVSHRYFQCAVPPSVGGAVDVMVIDLGLSLPSADFVYDDSGASMLGAVETSTYLGIVPIDGEPCHHMAFSQEGLEWQLWVSAGVHPTPTRISLRYTDRPGAPRFTADLDWQLSTVAFDDSAFTFVPDHGMTSVGTFDELLVSEGTK
ncbi:MAG: DUF2092 domain-containing protein [Planctomycetota bacterium]